MKRISRKPIDLLADPSRALLAYPALRVPVTTRRSPSFPISRPATAPFSTSISHQAEESSEKTSKISQWLWGKDKTEQETPQRRIADGSPTETNYKPPVSGEGLRRVGTPKYIEDLNRETPFKHQRFGGKAQPAKFSPEVKRTALLEAMSVVFPKASQEELLQLELGSSENKFQIAKEFQARTGMIVPDPILNSSKRGRDILSKLTEMRMTPKKVHEKVADGNVLEQLSNVTFSERRLGKTYKEEKIGRWKLIARRLDKHGLLRLSEAQKKGRAKAKARQMELFKT